MTRDDNMRPEHKTAGLGQQGQDVAGPQYASRVKEKRNDPRTGHTDVNAPPSENIHDRQGVSSKRGKRSSARKMESARHNFDTIPAARQPAGAFGREPGDSIE